MAIKQREQRGKDKNKRQPDPGAHLNNLPNTFKFAAETLKLMSERGGSAGSIVVSKYKSYNYKLIYALVMNTLKNIRLIKKVIHETKLQKKVITIHDPFMLEILVGDLLFGRGLKSVEQNQSAAAILNLKESITKQRDALKKDFSKAVETASSAKYLRINHLKSNIDHILSQLSSVGLKQVEYSKEKIKFKKFINKFKSLEANEFMLDFHFPNDLIVLTSEGADKLKKLDLLGKGKAMLQDKASFMAVEALDVKPGDKVIDACCAPGCKTSLIATKIKNKGKILAYDIDKKRLLTAQHLLKVQGATCVKTELLDFSKVKLRRLPKALGIEKFDSILIDPSCSGSGIQSRVDYKATKVEAGRLKKLQAFQVAMLKHALKADISKCIVYCTCSTSTEENEQVLEMALNESGVKSMWDAVEILPYWPHRGEQNYQLGQKYIRSDPNSLTNGFFIAKLVRNDNQNTGTSKDEMPETSSDSKDAAKEELDDDEADAEDEDEQMFSGTDVEGEEEEDDEEEEDEEEDEDEEVSDEEDE